MPNINAFQSVVHEKIFLRFINIFLILPLIWPQKGPAPLFEQIWIPIPQACFPPSLIAIGQVVHEKMIFKSFCYISLYELGCGHLWPQGVSLNKPESPCPKDVPCQISMHANGSWEEDFLRIINTYFAPYWAPKGASPLYLNKSESPSHKHVSHQVWLKLA